VRFPRGHTRKKKKKKSKRGISRRRRRRRRRRTRLTSISEFGNRRPSLSPHKTPSPFPLPQYHYLTLREAKPTLCSLSSIYSPPSLLLPVSYLLSTFVTKYNFTSPDVQSCELKAKLRACSVHYEYNISSRTEVFL